MPFLKYLIVESYRWSILCIEIENRDGSFLEVNGDTAI